MQQSKIIINIGRQIGSGGRTIAKMLADELDVKFYDKEILNLAAKESGFSEKFFEENDEKNSFAKSFFHTHIPLLGENNFYNNNFSQDSLYQFQSDAIRKAAEKSSCVFVGRTADYVLRDMENVINIFITANMEERITRVSERRELDREKARKYILEGESKRSSYYNYYTGKKWGSCESYDFSINSSLLGIEETEHEIVSLIKKKIDVKI